MGTVNSFVGRSGLVRNLINECPELALKIHERRVHDDYDRTQTIYIELEVMVLDPAVRRSWSWGKLCNFFERIVKIFVD